MKFTKKDWLFIGVACILVFIAGMLAGAATYSHNVQEAFDEYGLVLCDEPTAMKCAAGSQYGFVDGEVIFNDSESFNFSFE